MMTQPRTRILLEIGLIVIVAVVAARIYLDADPLTTLGGAEGEWLTSSAHHASTSLRTHGRIPLWQPYLARGEPSVEGAFSFILNPFSMVPSLIRGDAIGVRVSVVLHVILAGIGGWAIGWTLGLNTPARLLLGVLMLAKGNMPTLVGVGYFQLGVTQAYLPWLIAATLAIARWRNARTPVALLAITIALLWFGGNIYYILPGAIVCIVLGAALAIKRLPGRRFLTLRLDLHLLGRFALGAGIGAALMAATAIPIVINYNRMESHPDELLTNRYEQPLVVAVQLLRDDRTFASITWNENYHLQVVPTWYAAILFIVFPPFMRLFSRLPTRVDLRWTIWRTLVVVLLLAPFFLLWGTGTNPLMRWAITNLPGIGQWRTLSRLLTIVSLCLALIIGIRFDSLWRALVEKPRFAVGLRVLIGLVLAGITLAALSEPLTSYSRVAYLRRTESLTLTCLRDLRAHNPTAVLDSFTRDYHNVRDFLTQQVRFTHITADYRLAGQPSTLFDYDLRRNYARFLHSVYEPERDYWRERGYIDVQDSVHTPEGTPCLMEYPDALPYAFAASRDFLAGYVAPDDALGGPQFRGLKGSQVIALPHYVKDFDQIGLRVTSLPDDDTVVVVGDLAWTGWTVTVDGAPARLQSVGQLLGVVLPAGGAVYNVYFRYDPPLFKIGAAITLVTAAMLALWLLGVDRHLPWMTGRGVNP